MDNSNTPESQPPRRARIPRWAAPFMWVFGTLVIHVALPYAISLLGSRIGWTEGRPGLVNWFGLIPAAAGLAMIAWGASLHFSAAPGGWEWEQTPGYMIHKGPYRFSRNPMYLLEIAMWLGWALFYGSIAVLIAAVLCWIGFAFFMVPSEERGLEARFGEKYLEYKKAVPRWFGLPRRQGSLHEIDRGGGGRNG